MLTIRLRHLFLLAAVLGCLCIQAKPARSAAAKPPARAPIAVVKTVVACPAADRGYSETLASRVGRWLRDGGVKVDAVDDRALASALAGRRLVYLVVCQKPTAGQLQALERYRARGGKVAVLQSYSPALASFMGVPPVTRAPAGRATASAVPAGWWAPNVFASGDADETKARLLLGMAGAAVPGSWSAAAWEAKRKARLAAERSYGRAQQPRPGEIHAVWDHSGCGLHPGDWPRTMRELKAYGVTDLFVNVAGAGFAHYASDVLPVSQTYLKDGDQLAAAVAAGRAAGVRVHAWLLCFNAARATAVWKNSFAKRGWRLKNKAGVLTDYLDPARADLRWYLMRAVDELARKYPVDGVHLDFVRWYEGAAKPANAAATMTSFVAGARAKVRAARPRAWLTAAVLPGHPSCVRSVAQDWKGWIDAGLVDYVVPMNYVENAAQYAALVAKQGDTRAHARRVISGLGVTANESTLTPAQVIDQVNAARRAGFAGVSLFQLDANLATRVLPVLRLGLFR